MCGLMMGRRFRWRSSRGRRYYCAHSMTIITNQWVNQCQRPIKCWHKATKQLQWHISLDVPFQRSAAGEGQREIEYLLYKRPCAKAFRWAGLGKTSYAIFLRTRWSPRERYRLAPFFIASQCACEPNGTASYSYENSEERRVWSILYGLSSTTWSPYSYSAVLTASWKSLFV